MRCSAETRANMVFSMPWLTPLHITTLPLLLLPSPPLATCYLLQLMSSGMTTSTAELAADGRPPACEGSFRDDLVGLRPLGRCSYVPDPAFGMVEVDWEGRVVTLSVRNGTGAGGSVASGLDGSRQLLRFHLDGCQPLSDGPGGR